MKRADGLTWTLANNKTVNLIHVQVYYQDDLQQPHVAEPHSSPNIYIALLSVLPASCADRYITITSHYDTQVIDFQASLHNEF